MTIVRGLKDCLDAMHVGLRAMWSMHDATHHVYTCLDMSSHVYIVHVYTCIRLAVTM